MFQRLAYAGLWFLSIVSEEAYCTNARRIRFAQCFNLFLLYA